jgi:hypothetical protein
MIFHRAIRRGRSRRSARDFPLTFTSKSRARSHATHPERLKKCRGRLGAEGVVFPLTPTLSLGEREAASAPHETPVGHHSSQDCGDSLPLLGERAGVRETECIARPCGYSFHETALDQRSDTADNAMG